MRLSCPVHFANLHKIKLLVGVVEGFDLSAFDDARGIVSLPPPPTVLSGGMQRCVHWACWVTVLSALYSRRPDELWSSMET